MSVVHFAMAKVRVEDKVTQTIVKSITDLGKRVAFQAGEIIAGELRRQIASWPDAPSGLSTKTGALARSFKADIRINGSKFTVEVSSNLPYAGIQDTGGTIVPTRRRYLAIPLTKQARRRRPREWPTKLVCIHKRSSEDPVLAEIKGKGKRAKVVAQYLLRKYVTLAGHHYIEAARKEALKKIKVLIANTLKNSTS